MATRNLHLLVIDPQNDFCDLPAGACGDAKPSLPVTGAHADMQRVARLIGQAGAGLTAITVTLDTHRRLDIAHPGFWRRGDGTAVSPFTPITAHDVRSGAYVPRLPGAAPRVLAYLDTLEAAGRYTHMVWPVHCEVGTWGHNVHSDLGSACSRWEESTLEHITWISKGMNPWTEHFSAVQAEVPDADDPSTERNYLFLETLRPADNVFIAGEAGSHCVRSTTEHIAEFFADERLSRFVLLEDCMSPVAGFEREQAIFLREMRARGLQIATCADARQALLANACP
jgi:nicotinamidase-related amidase